MGVFRILLAVSVFCGHAQPIGGLRWLDANLAVELFFVISGFYMQLVLDSKYTKAKLGSAWIRKFYQARYFRLLPIYVIGILLAAILGLLRPGTAPVSVWKFVFELPHTLGNQLFQLFLILTNATMLFQDATMFLAVRAGGIHWSQNFQLSDIPLWKGLLVPQAWSLGIELGFYIVAPYLLTRRTRWLLLAACLCLAVKLYFLHALLFDDPWTYRFFPFELGYFLLGALAFRFRGLFEPLVTRKIERHWYLAYVAVIAFTTLQIAGPIARDAYPFAAALLLAPLFKLTSQQKVDRLIGEASYPFYIFHMSALLVAGVAAKHWFNGSSMAVAWIGLVLTAAAAALGLTFELWYVEPWRERFTTRGLPAPSGSQMADRAEAKWPAEPIRS